MSKLIRRTIIITIIERWTFRWSEAQQAEAGKDNPCPNDTEVTHIVIIKAEEILMPKADQMIEQ